MLSQLSTPHSSGLGLCCEMLIVKKFKEPSFIQYMQLRLKVMCMRLDKRHKTWLYHILNASWTHLGCGTKAWLAIKFSLQSQWHPLHHTPNMFKTHLEYNWDTFQMKSKCVSNNFKPLPYTSVALYIPVAFCIKKGLVNMLDIEHTNAV